MRRALALAFVLSLAAAGTAARAGQGGYSAGSHGGGGQANSQYNPANGGYGYAPNSAPSGGPQAAPSQMPPRVDSLGVGPEELPQGARNPGASPQDVRMSSRPVNAFGVLSNGDGEAAPPADDPPSQPVTLDDARDNFAAVVSGHVAKGANDGVWTWKDGARAWKLRYEDVDAASVHAVRGAVYAGTVLFRDLSRKPVRLEFSVDFGASAWKVTGVRRPAAPARSAKARP